MILSSIWLEKRMYPNTVSVNILENQIGTKNEAKGFIQHI